MSTKAVLTGAKVSNHSSVEPGMPAPLSNMYSHCSAASPPYLVDPQVQEETQKAVNVITPPPLIQKPFGGILSLVGGDGGWVDTVCLWDGRDMQRNAPPANVLVAVLVEFFSASPRTVVQHPDDLRPSTLIRYCTVPHLCFLTMSRILPPCPLP